MGLGENHIQLINIPLMRKTGLKLGPQLREKKRAAGWRAYHPYNAEQVASEESESGGSEDEELREANN